MSKETAKKQNGANKEKSTTVVIAVLGVCFFIGAIVLVLSLMGVFGNGKDKKDEKPAYVLTSSDFSEKVSEDSDLYDKTPISDNYAEHSEHNSVPNNGFEAPGAGQDNSSVKVEKTTVPVTQKNAAVEYYEQLSPKGNNILSDNCENEFIKLISETYNIDSDLLVAVYSTPDNGDNFVLQFNGTKDDNGNYVKSPATLEKVYQIDKARTVKIATGKKSGNVGVSYGEGMLCFNMIKTVVMEQYPDYFTGLKGKK